MPAIPASTESQPANRSNKRPFATDPFIPAPSIDPFAARCALAARAIITRRSTGYRYRVTDEELLAVALEQARIGRAEGGVPIGAAILIDGEIVGAGHNRRVQLGSAIRHGETDALEVAGRLPASKYRRATMATTLSPCDMCTGAILLYGIPRLVIGENRTFMGGEDHLRSRGVEIVNLDSAECYDLLHDFIADHPEIWNEDIGEE
jgi:cytosine deaminase